MPWEYRYVVNCDYFGADNPSDVMCPAAFCEQGNERGISFRVYRRRADAPAESPWDQVGDECFVDLEPIPLDDVIAAARARIREDVYTTLGRPTIDLDPNDTGLVNLPVIASTTDPGRRTLDFTQPLPGRVVVAPTFTWAWSNGTTSEGVGTPYTPGVTVRGNPDYYPVKATYGVAGPGSVELTVTWSGTIEVAGNEPIALDPAPQFTASEDFAVAEAHTRLTSG